MSEESTTRAEILSLIVADGPITAGDLAERLGLAAAGVRRHLSCLIADRLIEDHRVSHADRSRGRPARHFVATDRAHAALGSQGDALAVQLLDYLAEVGGDGALVGFAARRGAHFERRYAEVVRRAGEDVEARAAALVAALTQDGYAASLRPGPGSLTVQLCQGHCPVHAVARAFPRLCEEETQAISRILGVHVQRLATLASGEHVCTTCVPVTPPTPESKEYA
ncbi:MAG: winged helix-turn-helix transcriptional regulator [Bifidobacteriaceae bacterium]|nr:winged helix-turn-helix transcriptional regulator [Bifidobacteriaceae bacterium]